MIFKNRTSLLLIPLLFSVILTSCGPNNDSKVLIPQVQEKTINQENYALSMTKDRFLAFKEGKRSFILLATSLRCPYCQELEPLLVNYVKEKKVEIYKLEGTSSEFTTNSQFFMDELEGGRGIGTPTIYIFANGEIVKRERSSTNLKNRKQVITFFDEYIKTLKYYVLGDISSLNNPKNSIYFKYDFDLKFSQSLVNNNFYPLFSKKTTVYLIDEAGRGDLEISFSDLPEVFTFSGEESDLTAALTFFTTNFS